MTPSLRFRASRTINYWMEKFRVAWLWVPLTDFRRFSRKEIPVIASLTTYPPRISHAWTAIETLLRQSVTPIQLLLVLNLADFPDKKIPRKIQEQTRRGLTILWAEKNGLSYDKLLPLRTKFPTLPIVTFDDDKYFPESLMESIYLESRKHPKAVIGSRGWVIKAAGDLGEVHYGENWDRVESHRLGYNLITPGGNGCLYPPDAFDDRVDDMDQAVRVCPTADDVWFWSATVSRGTEIYCLGMKPHRPVASQRDTKALSDINEAANDGQFQAAVDFFGIRSRVLEILSSESAAP